MLPTTIPKSKENYCNTADVDSAAHDDGMMCLVTDGHKSGNFKFSSRYLKWQAVSSTFVKPGDNYADDCFFSGLTPDQVTSSVSIKSVVKENPTMKWSGCVVNGDSLLLRFPLTGLDEYFPAFKDIICALMELADQALNCCRIVVCVDKHLARQGLGRSFKTCGFHLMHPSRFSLKEDCMLFSFEF